MNRTLTDREVEVCAEAAARLRQHRREGLRTVVAGAIGGSGAAYFGLNLVARVSSICAEPAAISAAFLAGETTLESVVAVCHLPDLSDIVVISPCGACRELIHTHQPGCRVLVRPDRGEVAAVRVEQLLPWPDVFLEIDRR